MTNYELLEALHAALSVATITLETRLDKYKDRKPDNKPEAKPVVFHELPAKDSSVKQTDILTIREAIKRAKNSNLGITETAIRRMVKNGELQHILVGNRFYISWNSLLYLFGLKPEDKP